MFIFLPVLYVLLGNPCTVIKIRNTEAECSYAYICRVDRFKKNDVCVSCFHGLVYSKYTSVKNTVHSVTQFELSIIDPLSLISAVD